MLLDVPHAETDNTRFKRWTVDTSQRGPFAWIPFRHLKRRLIRSGRRFSRWCICARNGGRAGKGDPLSADKLLFARAAFHSLRHPPLPLEFPHPIPSFSLFILSQRSILLFKTVLPPAVLHDLNRKTWGGDESTMSRVPDFPLPKSLFHSFQHYYF